MSRFSLIICALLLWALRANCSEPSKLEEIARKLRPHFMLGLGSAPNDGWIEETRKQGANWDVRYQYICGGCNTPSNWKTWNQPAGAFVSMYLHESGRMNVVPCLTWYQMLQSLPGRGRGGEDVCNKINCENAGTMNAYFEDFKLLMKKCGEFGKPVIVHHEPDLWGYMRISPAFAPNDPEQIKVMVRSSGFPEAAEYPDTAAGFGKTLVALRDKFAPNVLLAWHASKWGNPDVKKMSEFCLKSGKWDLLFTDFSDRDSGWKIAHNYMAGGAWWSDKDFDAFRDWSAQLHQATGLPIMAWQVPIGNTIMATCNNTEGHYMDNRPEYFLENYPQNAHIAEWTKCGFIGLLFGGGAGGCTGRGDGCKDGITNPEPIKGNKGEKAQYADDDGGYLRLRGANYYTKSPVPLLAPVQKAAEKPAVVAAAKPAALDPKVQNEYQEKLIARINGSVKDRRKVGAYVRVGSQSEKHVLLGADENDLRIDVQGNAMPIAWKTQNTTDRANIAKALIRGDDDVEGLMIAAVFLFADNQVTAAQEFVARAALHYAAATDELKVLQTK